MALAVAHVAPNFSARTQQQQQRRSGGRPSGGSGGSGGGGGMLRLASLRGRILGRAADVSSSLLVPHGAARDASTKVAAAAAARAARAEAPAAEGAGAAEAKVRRGELSGWRD